MNSGPIIFSTTGYSEGMNSVYPMTNASNSESNDSQPLTLNLLIMSSIFATLQGMDDADGTREAITDALDADLERSGSPDGDAYKYVTPNELPEGFWERGWDADGD